MKRILFICLYFSFCLTKAQNNLVPNWSFENIISCPNYIKNATTAGDTAIRYALPWGNGNIGTVDLHSVCDTFKMPLMSTSFDGVPSNLEGYQLPRTGNNYAGLRIYPNPVSGQNYSPLREYAQVKLIDSLRANKKYCASFYVSLADSSSYYATSRMGCYISKNKVGDDTTHLINASPQIENSYHNFLNNYLGWSVIQGVYTANGGENYITIGNFYTDANTDTLPIHLNSYAEVTYYYLDDVSLTEYNTAYAGNDTTVCKDGTVNLGNSNAAFGANYNWSILKGDSSSLKYNDTLSYNTAQPKKNTTYVLQKKQCGIVSYDTLTIHIPIAFIVKESNDTTICIGDSALLSAYNLCNWCIYNWQPVQIQSPNVIVNPLASTTYTLSVKDSCFTTYSNVTVIVDYCQSPIIVVPNIFTPNADGINDAWQPLIQNPLSLLNYQCTIYDRWGIKIFDALTNLNMIAWDGYSTSGLECSSGTYYYVISYTDGKTNEKKNLKGFLELVK